eukprot:m.129717 g.129717  ORF g.129717 m.129717 type:complete len:113 (+) comp14757_c0_seq13:2192-2530(+)
MSMAGARACAKAAMVSGEARTAAGVSTCTALHRGAHQNQEGSSNSTPSTAANPSHGGLEHNPPPPPPQPIIHGAAAPSGAPSHPANSVLIPVWAPGRFPAPVTTACTSLPWA